MHLTCMQLDQCCAFKGTLGSVEQVAGHHMRHEPAMAAILGVCCAGDRLNFGLAVEQAKSEGYKASSLSTVVSVRH